MYLPLLRVAVLSLPALLLLTSLATLLLSLPAWGAGANAGLSDWMPTVAGIVLGLPAAIISAVCLSKIVQATRGLFGVTPLLLLFGLLILPIAIATQAAVAAGVADPATYDRLLEPTTSAPGAALTLPDDTGPVSPAGFMAGTALISIFLNAAVVLAAVIYASAITADSGQRFARKPEEPDAIDDMIHGRRGPRASQP